MTLIGGNRNRQPRCVLTGVLISPVALLAAASVGLSTPRNVIAPTGAAIVLVFAIAATAVIPSMRRAALLPPAELLRDGS